ncbi:MAG: MBG domain-containing protein, partial [Clostridia bacterium]|nr:MBG domain-containing protein [Clostridia bacterium]
PPVAGAQNIVVEAEINVDYDGTAVDYSATNVPNGVGVSYSIVKDGQPFESEQIVTVGVYTVTVSFTTAADKADIAPKTCVVTISKGTYNMNGVALSGDLNPVYNGQAHTLTLTGTLPAGVDYSISYTQNGEEVEPVNAGDYDVTVTFTGDYDNYIKIGDITATLTVGKATVTGIVFAGDVKPEITGETYTLEATGVPEWVTVTYSVTDEDENALEGKLFGDAGKYIFTATFTHSNDNYEQIGPKTATLVISDKPPVEGADDIVVEAEINVDYNGSPVDYSAKNVPDGVGVSYEILKDGEPFDGEEIVEVGVYTITVIFETAPDKAPIASKPCVVTISKGTYNMDGVELTGSRTVVFDGEAHGLTLAGTLPDGVEYTVKYYLNGEETTPIAVGTYDVVVTFTNPDTVNYNDIGNIEATLTISDAVITSISAAVDEGAAFTTVNTLDELKAKLTVTAVYDNGSTEAVEEFTISAAIRDGGLLEVGTQTVTVTYDDFTTTVQIEVARAKVALPVYKNTLSYSGGEIKPTAADFEGFDGALMAFVADKTDAGLNAGTYKAVFALTDTERYEWATATTFKKALFAVALYDETALDDNEAAVEWSLARAKISATRANGSLPVFASESFGGSLADIVGLKYYSDETCTEEISADELAYSTKYYVKAELLDGANFELDESAMAFSATAFEYTTPEKELTLWEKVVKFVFANWLWIAIGAAVLLVLIIIIACAARSAKKKREREERRIAEEKEERRREKEEREERRREEREERM